MKVLVCLALLCAVAYASEYRQPTADYGYERPQTYTRAPEYFVTSRYGPVKRGHLAGHGQRSSGLNFQKTGTAHGSLYARDLAEAQESAAKTRGYQYQYKEGHKYYQPKNLYSYSESGPIIGYEDVYEENGYEAPAHEDAYGAPAREYGYAAPSRSYGNAAPSRSYGNAAPSRSYGYAAPSYSYRH
ncbi:PREDICTED: uncharacterized protein LOC106808585 [Priapulus caudatus]|uniref:Uncharacterized protein LOC106808585 n=1 Tax=Priapulus caudatus TaxID=37621 RepID=A0ABM1E3R7_PRICU|nr:PREDICTED: uncharacterized protein LOC106808585 [Priapulus caudatus]